MSSVPVQSISGERRLRREGARRLPTTQGFAALHDHARLPWRFFGRFSASLAGLSRA